MHFPDQPHFSRSITAGKKALRQTPCHAGGSRQQQVLEQGEQTAEVAKGLPGKEQGGFKI